MNIEAMNPATGKTISDSAPIVIGVINYKTSPFNIKFK
jgi:hypothetical protein